MRRFIRSIFAIIIPFVLIYGINSVTGYYSWWLSLIVCFSSGYPILYLGGSVYYAEIITRKEYIIDLHNNKVGDLFVPARYPKYKKTNTGPDGNDYISDSGSVICTKFVNVKEKVKMKENGLSIHISCILICLLSFLLWNYLADSPSIGDAFQSRIDIVVKHFSELKTSSLYELTDRGGESLTRIGGNTEQIYSLMKSNIKLDSVKSLSDIRFAVDGWNELVSRFSKNIDKLLSDITTVF